MNRLTVSIPEELSQILEREARREKTSVSDVVRRALRSYLTRRDDSPNTLPFAGIGRSGTHDTARNAERILEREWGRARDR